MKRDMSLVRKILTWAIDQPNGCLAGNPEFVGYSDEVIGYHVHLMEQAGLVQAAGATTLGSTSPHAILLEVTWAGHDFADAARDDALWKKATVSILKEGASFSFDLLKEWLKMSKDSHGGGGTDVSQPHDNANCLIFCTFQGHHGP